MIAPQTIVVNFVRCSRAGPMYQATIQEPIDNVHHRSTECIRARGVITGFSTLSIAEADVVQLQKLGNSRLLSF